jgi:hypothetical protein
VVAALPTPASALVGNLFYLSGPPGGLYELRLNGQGNLVYTKLDGRTCILQLCNAGQTPGVGANFAASTQIVPYDLSENTLTSVAWTVVNIIFRQEVTGTTQSQVQVQRYTGTGAFSNTGYINTTAVTIAANAYEQTTNPASLAVTTVNSGDKLRAYFPALGTGSSGYTVYIQLRESDNY